VWRPILRCEESGVENQLIIHPDMHFFEIIKKVISGKNWKSILRRKEKSKEKNFFWKFPKKKMKIDFCSQP